MRLEVKAQEGKPIKVNYFVILLQNEKYIGEEPISPFDEEKEKDFIIRVSSELALFNIEHAETGESKRLVTR